MRTRADVFAIVTITLLFVVQTLAFNLHGLTGGAQGMSCPVAAVPGGHLRAAVLLRAASLLLALAMLLTFGAMRSKFGLSLAAVRGRRGQGARASAFRSPGVKVLAFSVSVGLTAMVGAVWAYYEVFIYPQFAVDPLITIAMVLMTFLGGRAHAVGPGARARSCSRAASSTSRTSWARASST